MAQTKRYFVVAITQGVYINGVGPQDDEDVLGEFELTSHESELLRDALYQDAGKRDYCNVHLQIEEDVSDAKSLRRRTEAAAMSEGLASLPKSEIAADNYYFLAARAAAYAEQLRRDRSCSKADKASSECPPLPKSASLATIVIAGQAIITLDRIRTYEQTAIDPQQMEQLQAQLIAAIDGCLEDDSLRRLREIFKPPSPGGSMGEAVHPLVVLGLMHLSTYEDETHSTKERGKAAIEWCQREALESVRSIALEIGRVEVFDCWRLKDASDSLHEDPRRHLRLLSEYWSILQQVVVADCGAYMFSVPHPLLRWIVNLRQRIEATFVRLAHVDGVEDASKTVTYFLAVLATSEHDELTAVPEETDRLLAKVQLFLERAKSVVGRWVVPLEIPEEKFLEAARAAVRWYEQSVAARNKKWDEWAEKEREDRQKSSLVQGDANSRKGGKGDSAPVQGSSQKAKKIQIALRLIQEKGHVKGAVLAKAMSIRESTFLKHYRPLLEEYGVKNDKNRDGYYLPKKPEDT